MTNQFEPIKASLARQLRRQGLSAVAEAAYVCEAANQLAEGRFEAIRWQAGRLTVVTKNSVIAHELSFVREELIRTLREKLGWRKDQPLSMIIQVRP